MTLSDALKIKGLIDAEIEKNTSAAKEAREKMRKTEDEKKQV